MKSFPLALLLSSASGASLRPRQSNSGCCFQLASVGMVNETVTEDHVGELLLGGAFQQGGFCLDTSTKTIRDGLKHNCFMRAPVHQFECYAGIIGATAFEVTPPKEDGKYYLAYDGGPGIFYACPVGSGATAYYDIYSSEKADKTGCLPVSLALSNETPECAGGNASAGGSSTSTAVPQKTSVVRRTSQAVLAEPSPTSTRTVILPTYTQSSKGSDLPSTVPTTIKKPLAPAAEYPTSSPVCSVAPSAPSIAPVKVGYPDPSSPDGIKDTSGEASISSANSTILQYVIPRAFLPPREDIKAPICALQFRMPVCTSLPEGYPCYMFSGLEQEILSNSGMTFNLTLDDNDATWDGANVHQVFPGENTILGTFECGSNGKDGFGGRKMQWLVSSVRDFSLEFFHAGVGESPQFEDGIGAWIVPCS
ncbi:hypothetical protein F4809DRAFT_606518 [Biscogniauxia mediterranea]|nr:hypothetical protein F4809DRAFT_606518 [Biscogniauxia mediterranea]